MEKSKMQVGLENGFIDVIVERKSMKTMRLKVYPERIVKLSVPKATADEAISSFLEQKSAWIKEKLEMFAKTKGYASTTYIKSGVSIKMFGEDLIFSVSKCDNNLVYKEGKTLCVCSNDISNQEKVMMLFGKWWRTESLKIISGTVQKLYPIVGKYGIDFPEIRLRKMKTLWGSCSVGKGKITFNQYLTKAKPACVEYVVLHELIHFLYPNHSKKFYDFLSSYMPDWKERKKILDTEEVHGL